MGIEWPWWPGEWGKSSLKIHAKELLENLSDNDLSDYTKIIKDSTRPIEYKTDAIKKLLKHSNGIEWLKSFLMSNDADCKMENKILIMKTCIQESDDIDLRDNCGLSDFIKSLLLDLNGMNILKEIIHPKNTEINTKTKILIIKHYLKKSDDFKLWLKKELGLTDFIESLLSDLEGKISKKFNHDWWMCDSVECKYNWFFTFIKTIETELKKIIKENKIIKNSKLLSNDSLSKSTNLRKYAKDNKWNVTFTSDPHTEYRTYFKYKINFEDLQKEIINYMKTKIYEQWGIKAKCDILPELLFLENLSSEIKNWKQDKEKWNNFFDWLAVDFKNCNHIQNLNILDSWPENEFKKKAKEILKNFWWKNYSKQENEYQKKLTHIKQGIEDGSYYFITLPDDETGENSNDEEKQILDRIEKLLFEEKDEEKDKVNDINLCKNYSDIQNYLEKYGIKRDITDNFKEIFFNKLWLWFNYGFYKWNEMKIGNKNPKLEERRFNSIKTFLLLVQPKAKVNEDKLKKYIFGKIFSTHYEYSNCDDKKNLIKHFLWEWGVINNDNVKEWNCNENGLDLDEFLTAFYEETNIAFAQNFQKWNKWEYTQFWLKSDIIEAIMKIVIDRTQNEIKSQKWKEKFFNILKAPLCHTENWEDFWFNIDDNLYDHTNGARIKDEKTKQELFDNIKYILWDSTSNPPSRTFKINGHGWWRTHNGVYTDQKSWVPMIRINDTDRFLLKNYGRYLTILWISWHGKNQQYQTDINNARNN